MKTDRFDEEFRRKLQDLPVDTEKADVERTYAYVRTNNPVVYGVPWSKLLPFGVGGLLLLGSLLYNGIQYARTTQLQISVDSLSSQSTSQTMRLVPVQHDTIYITRFEQAKPFSSPASPDGYPEQTAQSAPKLSAILPSVPHTVDEAAPGEARLASRADQRGRGIPSGTSRPEPSFPADVSVEVNPSIDRATPRIDSVNAVGGELANPASLNRSPRSLAKTSHSAASPATTPLPEAGTDGVASVGSPESTTRRSVMIARSARRGRNEQSNSPTPPSRRVGTIPPVSNNRHEVTAIASRPVIPAEMIVIRPLNLTRDVPTSRLTSRSLTTPETAVVVVTKQTKRPWHLAMPRLSVPNAQYRVGTGLLGGPDQLSGAILGELQINRHWSVQTGVQVSLVDGFHYRDEQDFGKHRSSDFRQAYGVQAPASADIEDINLRSTLIQLPVQIAYHYPLGRQWGLRLGLGTELTLALRSTVGYDYRENNRSNEYELTINNGHTRVFNNLTIGTSLERAWKRWQFRAGPFISPQLRPVSYKSDDLIWGGTVQVFYRLRN